MNCLLCNIPLPPDWSAWPVHTECCTCIYCGEEVQRTDIEKCIKESIWLPRIPTEPATEPPTKIEVFHTYCHNAKLEADYKQKPATVTQEHLDMLNAANLMFQANLSWSVETNQKDAEHHARKWMHEKSIDELFVSMKRLEAVAAMYSIALSKEKDRIKIRLSELERINLKDLKNADDRIEFEKEKIKHREKEAVRLSPELRAQENAIKAMALLGMSREQALASIELQKEKRKVQ